MTLETGPFVARLAVERQHRIAKRLSGGNGILLGRALHPPLTGVYQIGEV